VETVEVRVTRVGLRDAVDGSAGGDAVLLHAGNDRVLGEGGEAEHDEGDDDAHDAAGPEHARDHADGEEHNDEGSGVETFMVQNVQAFGDDRAGNVGVGDGAECSRGGDGEEEESAEPHDESEPDQGTQQGFHARQGTACGSLGDGNPKAIGIGAQRAGVSKPAGEQV